MIEKTIYDYMTEELSVPCYMMRPERVQDEYVLIEKTGGSETNHVKRSTFAFQSYAPTLLRAAEINEEVKALAADLVTLPEVYGSRYSSDYNFTNTATKQPRYQAVFNIYHY